MLAIHTVYGFAICPNLTTHNSSIFLLPNSNILLKGLVTCFSLRRGPVAIRFRVSFSYLASSLVTHEAIDWSLVKLMNCSSNQEALLKLSFSDLSAWFYWTRCHLQEPGDFLALCVIACHKILTFTVSLDSAETIGCFFDNMSKCCAVDAGHLMN